MVELSLLGVVMAGYAGSVYWTGYQRALGQAADHCQNDRHDLAMKRLKRAVLLPPLGGLVDQWALCLNFQSYLYILQKQPDWAEKRLKLIERRPGICEAVRSLCFYRRAEINDLKGFPNEARACREQAQERFEAGKEELESRELWKPLALMMYGTGDYTGAVDALDRLLKKEWSPPLLFLRWLSLERTEAPKEKRLGSCREALKYETLPARRAYLLAAAAELEEEESPQSSLEAARACLKEQSRLRNSARADITAWARGSRLGALSRLNRDREYRETRMEFMNDLELRDPIQLHVLCTVLRRERRLLECLHHTESATGVWVKAQRAASLYEVGRPKDALTCFGGQEHWSCASTMADCYLCVLDRREADRAIERLRVQDEKEYLVWRSSKATFWDGDVALAQELWPHPYPDSTLLMYQGRFQECWEAWTRQIERSVMAPSAKSQTRLYFGATLMMLEERWGEALEHLERVISCSDQDPLRQNRCSLYLLSCRCRMGEELLEDLEKLSADLSALYSQAPLVQLDIALTTADVLSGLGHHEHVLDIVQTTLPGEPRAFYRAFLMDLRSASLTSLGRSVEAEVEDQLILQTAPGSFWSERAVRRLRLPRE